MVCWLHPQWPPRISGNGGGGIVGNGLLFNAWLLALSCVRNRAGEREATQ